MFSALDLDVVGSLPMPDNTEEELKSQAEAPRGGSEIWIITDVLGEAEDRTYARKTVDNILNRRLKYRYFLPFDSQEWIQAKEWLEDEARSAGADPDVLEGYISVFDLSDCAFSCRLRITNPRSTHPVARYGFGPRATAQAMFPAAPMDLVIRTVTTLTRLLRKLEDRERQPNQDDQSKPGPAVGSHELGFIRRRFPERH